MKIFRLFFILPFILFSCQEVIEPDLGETQNIIVIEGLITNAPGPYKVKVTKTKSFYANVPPPAVEFATVIISDNEGVADTLKYTGEGVYQTSRIQGKVGNVYTLRVISDGKTYESTQPMLRVTAFEGNSYTYIDKIDFIHQEVGYYVSLGAKEPQETTDYYQWKFYQNNELADDNINIAEDEAVKGDIVGLEVPVAYQLGDTARIEMYSLTEEAFNFYEGLNANINNDGGFFSSPPANPASNISNGALGMFQVSAVEVAEIVIQ